MNRVEHVMGTVVSVDVRDADVHAQPVDRVVAWFHEVDERFSTYRDHSEVCRLGRGELRPGDGSDDLRGVVALCDEVHRRSGGAFDAWRSEGAIRFDPSAVVKGWSVDRAGSLLWEAGIRNFCINAGGDVVTRGRPTPDRAWRIGIRHPERPDRVAVVVSSADGAVATSGAYERGAHIIDPRVGNRAAPPELMSVTVIGPSLAYADAYSTAAYVLGVAGVAWVAEQPGYDAYAITVDNDIVSTPGFAARIAAPAGSR